MGHRDGPGPGAGAGVGAWSRGGLPGEGEGVLLHAEREEARVCVLGRGPDAAAADERKEPGEVALSVDASGAFAGTSEGWGLRL